MLQGAEKRFQTDPGHTQGQVEDAQRSAGDSISGTHSPTPGQQKLSPEKEGAPPGVLNKGRGCETWCLSPNPSIESDP